jgi:CTP synthase (UTP-ammonia lyase)
MEILNDFSTSVEKALSEIDENWKSYEGLIICGTHSPHGTEGYIDKITKAREKGLPYLGICFGHQLAAIEYARSILGIADATSEEFGSGTYVVRKRKEGLKVGLHDGESYWHNYEVTIDFKNPPNFITVQYHPEYQSSKDRAHPILVTFLKYAREYTKGMAVPLVAHARKP